jgi:hypothetical protein
MGNPIVIGLVMGGAFAGWRFMRERGRIRHMLRKLARESVVSEEPDVVRLERDPKTGIYAPRKEG